MVINTKAEKQEIYDKDLWYHVLGNDYIVYVSKMANKKESLKISLDSLPDGNIYDDKTLFRPILTSCGDYYCEYRGYIKLNDYVVLLSFSNLPLAEQSLGSTLRDMVVYRKHKNARISGLFNHMKEFIEGQKIEQYKAGYEKLSRDINSISNSIVAYVSDKYSDAQTDAALLNNITEALWAYLPEYLEGIRFKITYNLHNLIKSHIIIRLRRIKIKLKSLVSIKLYYKEEMYSKKTKNFIINAAISSFIKVLPIDLWRLYNNDALSILVKPKVQYEAVHENELWNTIHSIAKDKTHKTKLIFIKPNYYLILVIDYTLSNSIKPIRVSLNITGLSLLLKSKSIKNFVIVLNEVINNVHEGVMDILWPGYLVCSRLAV